MKETARVSLRRKLLERAGFTRLQHIMILVLVLILAVICTYAFTGYRKSAYQVKADRTAEKVFDIAEKYIRIETSAGRLEDFNNKAASFGGIVPMDTQEEILKGLYSGNDFEKFFAKYKDSYKNVPVYYITMESKSAAGESREENPILDMFEYQMVDENIAKHTFLIEYNGNTGRVMSVIYSEKADTFTYDGNREDKSNVMVRDAKSMNAKWQGYCGVDLEEL